MIKGCQLNLPFFMMKNIIMTHDQKQKYLSYGQVLTSIFKYFRINLTNMDINLYSKLIEINNKTFTKMKYMLNEDGVWVPTDQRGAHVEEENDAEKEKKHIIGSDDKFKAMFETSPITSSF